MKQENIIKFEDIRTIKGIPEIAGYKIIENFLVDKFFSTLSSHSTDLYLVRLYSGKRVETLMYGSCIGSNSKLSAAEANRTYGDDLKHEVSSFALIAPEKVIGNRVALQTSGMTTIMAARCNKGYIVAGWLNSNADGDISKQMLAYIMMNFAALNSFGTNADGTLKEQAYDTIPTDSRLGTFNPREAKQIFRAEIFTREQRMSLRRQNLSTCSKPC